MKLTFTLLLLLCSLQLPLRAANVKVTATVKKIAMRHQVTKDGETGMEVLCSFEVSGMKGFKGKCIAYFETLDGKALRDSNKRYRTTTGNVSASREINPGYDTSVYDDFAIFIPYSELHLAADQSQDCRVDFYIFCEGKQVVGSDPVYFKWSGGHTAAWGTRDATEKAVNGRLTQVSHYLEMNQMENGQLGCRSHCKFRAHNMRNLNLEVKLQVDICHPIKPLIYSKTITCKTDNDYIDCVVFVPHADILKYREEYYKGRKKNSKMIVTLRFEVYQGDKRLRTDISTTEFLEFNN